MANRNQIETSAVSVITSILNRIDNIDTEFHSKDKNISFDGDLILYKSGIFKKTNYLGKLRVQIKGRTINQLPKPGKHNFSIDNDDAKIYYSEGGVFYFIVLFQKKDISSYKIYYKFFSSQQIRNRFLEMKKNNHKSVGTFIFFELNEKSKSNFYQYCIECIKLQKKQMPLTENPIDTIYKTFDLEKANSLHLFGFTENAKFYEIVVIGGAFHPKELLISTNDADLDSLYSVDEWNTSVCIYDGIEIPVWFQDSKFSITVKKIVIHNFRNGEGKIFSTKQSILKRSEHEYEIDVLPCLTIKTKGNRFTYNLTTKGSLIDRINAINILYAVYCDDLYIDSIKMSFHPKSIKKEEKEFFSIIPDLHAYSESILKVCEYIPVLEQVLYREFNREESDQLYQLSNLLNNNHEASEEELGLSHYQIGGIDIILLYYKVLENGKKVWKYCNPFNTIGIQLYYSYTENQTQKFEPITLFTIFNSDSWLKSMNLNREAVVRSIDPLDISKIHTREKLNNLVLNLIAAFDQSSNEEFLNLAEKIIQKIDEAPNREDYIHINFLQIKIRKEKSLNHKDRTWLNELLDNIEGDDQSEALYCSSLILLGRFNEASKLLATMNQEEKKRITEYPIITLLK